MIDIPTTSLESFCRRSCHIGHALDHRILTSTQRIPQACSRTDMLFVPPAACAPPPATLTGRGRPGITLSTTTRRPFTTTLPPSRPVVDDSDNISHTNRVCSSATARLPSPSSQNADFRPPLCPFEHEHSSSTSTSSLTRRFKRQNGHRMSA